MKTISFCQKLFAWLMGIAASVSSFAYNHQASDSDWTFVHDFVVDNFAYLIIPGSSFPAVALIESAGHSGSVDIPAYVTHNDTTYQVTTLGAGGHVFHKCRDLTSVYIPKEIKVINLNVFAECANLMHISVDFDNPYFDSRNLCHAVVTSPQNPIQVPNMLIAACKNTSIPDDVEIIGTYAFYRCHQLKQIVIPNRVTTIERSAFNECDQLSTLIIGESVSEINGYAFAGCSALKTVMCLAETPPFVREFAFSNTPVDVKNVYDVTQLLPVYVPDESVDLYKHQSPWSNYNIQPLSQANSPAYKSQWCNSWTTFFEDTDTDTEEKTWLYRLGQDTVIRQHTYTIVNRYTTMDGTEAGKEYVAAVRFTDDKKVYIFYDNTEYLLYDFNVQEGDIIEVFAGLNNYSERNKTFRCSVNEVNLSQDTGLREIHLYVHPNDMTAQIHETKWIEGVGDTQGFMMLNGFKYPRKTSSALVCASRNGQSQFLMDENKMASLATKCYCDFAINIEDDGKEGKFAGRPTPTQWHMLEENHRERLQLPSAQSETTVNSQSVETFVYELNRDTFLINNQPYLPLVRYSTKDDSPVIDNIGALYFSDKNQVFFHYDNTEYLLYDFGAAVGDTLDIFAGINNYPHTTTFPHVLTHKDTLSDGRAILTLQALLHEEEDGQLIEKRHKKVWVAGLGSLDGIVHNSIVAQSGKKTTMLCAWLEDECIYTTDLPFYKSLGCIYNNNAETAVEDVEIPIDSSKKLLRDGQLIIFHEGRIYNVMGQEVLSSDSKR